jgi:Ca2+-binding EF-hand superfamily protein
LSYILVYECFFLSNTLKDTFNAFDKDGSGEMGFPEYCEAWAFLGRGGSEEEIKTVWNSVDIDGSGLIEWTEFVFSLMGESALEFGSLADLEHLNGLLQDTSSLLASLRDDLAESQMSNGERAERNSELRARLEEMKKETGAQFGNMFCKMLSIMGKDPKDLLTDDQINKLLFETFKKFDKDASGELETPEFVKAWRFLGLKGGDMEIKRAFGEVDTNHSGKIDKFEFAQSIKGNRTEELSLTVLLTQMDGHLEGMEGFFTEYKNKVREAEEEAKANLALSRGDYDAFQKATRRRRLRKKEMEQNITKKTHELVVELRDIAGEPVVEDEGLKMYNVTFTLCRFFWHLQ